MTEGNLLSSKSTDLNINLICHQPIVYPQNSDVEALIPG